MKDKNRIKPDHEYIGKNREERATDVREANEIDLWRVAPSVGLAKAAAEGEIC